MYKPSDKQSEVDEEKEIEKRKALMLYYKVWSGFTKYLRNAIHS